MKYVNKQIEILWKESDSLFYKKNAIVIGDFNRRLGTSEVVEQGLLSNPEECAVIFPPIIASNPTDPNWQFKLSHYLGAISESIPNTGRKLEIGWVYDSSLPRVKEFMNEYNANAVEAKKLKNDEDLVNYYNKEIGKLKSALNSKIEALAYNQDEEKIKAYNEYYKEFIKFESRHIYLGSPLKHSDYLLWRIALYSAKVANHIALVKSSPNIKFYLEDKDEIRKQQEFISNKEDEAMELFLNFKKDINKVTDLLYILDIPVTEDSLVDIRQLKGVVQSNPNLFLSVAKDTNFATRALIAKALSYKLLSKVPLTESIFLTENASISFGNNIAETMAIITSPPTQMTEIVNNLIAKVKALSNNK